MDRGKLAVIIIVAASCAGCVTEPTKSVTMSAQAASTLPANVKEAEMPKREAQPLTWVSYGELWESKAADPKAAPYQKTALLEDARKCYQKAIDLDPRYIPAVTHLANLYSEQQDDPDRAIAVYQRAIQQNPKVAALWYEEGMVYCHRKDLNTALQCLAKAHDMEPTNRQFATNYGFCLARANRPQDAVAVFSTVETRAEANYDVARMMAHMDKQDLSRQYLQATLQERPSHQGALGLMAQLDDPHYNDQSQRAAGIQLDASVQPASYNAPR